MAKKGEVSTIIKSVVPEDTIPGYSVTNPGKGWKFCSRCEGYVKGAATAICPKCKLEVPKKVKKAVGKVEAEVVSTEDILRFALKHGGFDKAIAKVSEIKKKIDDDIRLMFHLGGPEALEARITAEKEASE